MSFDERAKTWDSSDRRQALAEAVANAIKSSVTLNSSMHLLDIGAGTGLLTRRILPYVDKITALDTSAGMLEELGKKVEGNVEIFQTDIIKYEPSEKFDGIISSMTLHHIEDTEGLFKHLYKLLKPGGFIALADLAPEDGTFHSNGNEGVLHFGFDEESLKNYANIADFKNFSYKIVHKVEKSNKIYEIFLFSSIKYK
ncbi:class I SAM-dependent methyltransferase [Hydrogenimonas thermophila]|uniref:class I SAM-dependent methyltransferase n=1 Tax=Hydrogenimonas thermophila TaxID=223786 RepID=UPI002937101B|nr:class I SAM-dependent methyltransferase [Hydrogenimonas thermophila]WOE71107.1 class I SAM-dependent methyltransferase [Hydrogenimonas thermophila]WOE73625.1 class I SAM-dependent methyltransferase [Hydrogenimonas thermophila]